MMKNVFKYQSATEYYPSGRELQKIQNCIRDENSKYIYSNCLLYSMTKDLYYIKNLVLTTPEGKNVYAKLHEIKKPLFIFGAGTRGKMLVDMFEDIPWAGLVDNHVCDSEYSGIPIITFEEALEKWADTMGMIQENF